MGLRRFRRITILTGTAAVAGSFSLYLYHQSLCSKNLAKHQQEEDDPPEAERPVKEHHPVYRDLPLDKGKRQIRLLTLQQGDENNSFLRYHMDVHSLLPGELPQYAALSYTWSDPINPSAPCFSIRGFWQRVCKEYRDRFEAPEETIFVNDHPFPAPKNLVSALTHLRRLNDSSPETPTRYWADAICLNQEDKAEKNHQLPLMTEIYTKAKRTFIWLGPSTDDSDKAMEFIQSAHQIKMINDRMDLNIEVPSDALRALYRRTWWNRVWVIQEAILSRSHANVVCGSKQVPFSHFIHLDSLEKELTMVRRQAVIEGKLGRFEKGAWNVIPDSLPPVALSSPAAVPWAKREASDLWGLVLETQDCHATKAVDRVYGLLGLLPRAQKLIRPDYKKSIAEVSKDLTLLMLANNHFIFWPSGDWKTGPLPKAEVEGPSWVFDLLTRTSNLHRGPVWSESYAADGGFLTWLRLTPFALGKTSVFHIPLPLRRRNLPSTF